MGIVIRTLYNNEDWHAPCTQPGRDPLCECCFWRKPPAKITPPKPHDQTCSGSCWEQHICTKFRWGSMRKGWDFGPEVHVGMNVFLVHREIYREAGARYTLYTVWGKTTVTRIDKLSPAQKKNKTDYAYMHFQPFQPLPPTTRPRNLTDTKLVCVEWGSAPYRFIPPGKQKELQDLIE